MLTSKFVALNKIIFTSSICLSLSFYVLLAAAGCELRLSRLLPISVSDLRCSEREYLALIVQTKFRKL